MIFNKFIGFELGWFSKRSGIVGINTPNKKWGGYSQQLGKVHFFFLFLFFVIYIRLQILLLLLEFTRRTLALEKRLERIFSFGGSRSRRGRGRRDGRRGRKSRFSDHLKRKIGSGFGRDKGRRGRGRGSNCYSSIRCNNLSEGCRFPWFGAFHLWNGRNVIGG